MKVKEILDFAYDNPDKAAQGVTGITQLAMNLFGRSNVYNDTSGNRMSTDMYGRPIYSTQAYRQSISNLRNDAKGEVLDSALSGFKSGLQAGGIGGNPITAGIGAGVGTILGIFGGAKRKKQLNTEADSREVKLKESIKGFNIDNFNYFDDVNTDSINSYLLNQRALRA